MPEFSYGFADDEPALNYGFADSDPDDDSQRELVWAGRPTTVAAVKRAAKEQGVSPLTIMELGTPAGRLESRIAKSSGGQVFLEAGEGFKQIGETILASGARALGFNEIANRVHADRRQRNEFMAFIEKGGDVEQVLGPRGSRIFNGVTRSVAQAGAVGKVAGQIGLYSHAAGSAWEEGLHDAERLGAVGAEAVGHATRSAVLEGGITFLMGRLGQKAGLTSLEESFSPAFRNAARSAIRRPEIRGSMAKLASELGGWTAEGAEEMFIEAGQQLNDMAIGARDEFDWETVLDSGATGVGSRGAVGASRSLVKGLGKLQKLLPDIAAGTRGAEIDIERGVNPLEALEYVADGKEFDRQTGRKGTTPQYRDSYREALDFYVAEMRREGKTGALAKMEEDVRRLREEDRQRAERIKQSKAQARNKGRAGESLVKTEPVVEQPQMTADERATFKLDEFVAAVNPDIADAITQPETNVNPYLRAPWESETRAERIIRARNEKIAEQKQIIAELRSAIPAQKLVRQDQLDTARQLVEENIPRSERAAFINRITKANTPAKLDKLLEGVVAAVGRREQKQARRGLYEALKKATNLRREFAEPLATIRAGFDFQKFNGREAAEKLRALADANPSMILSNDDKKNLDRLSQTNVNDMTAEDINDLAAHVQDLAYQSALADRLIGNTTSASLRDTADTIAQEAAAATQKQVKSRDVERRVFDKLRGVDTDATQGQNRTLRSLAGEEWSQRPEVTVQHLGQTLREYAYIAPVAAANQHRLWNAEAIGQFADVLAGVGLPHDASLDATLKEMVGVPGSELARYRSQTRIIAGQKLNRGESQVLSFLMRDASNAQALRRGGFTFEDGRVLPPLTPQMIAEITEFSDDVPDGQGRALLDWGFAFINGPMIDRVNDENERLTGRPLTTKKGVVPRRVQTDDEYVQFVSKGRSGFIDVLVDTYGSLKRREDVGKPLHLPAGMDFIDYLFNHIDRMHRFSAYGVVARNAEAVLNDETVKAAIKSKRGEQGYKSIVDAVQQQVAGAHPTDGKTRFIAAWNSAVAAAHLAGKATVLAGQVLDAPIAAAYVDGGFRHLRSAANEMADRDAADITAEMDRVLGRWSGDYWHRFHSEDIASVQTHGQIRRVGWFRTPSLAHQTMRSTAAAEFETSAKLNYLAAKASAREAFGLPNDFNTYENDEAWGQFVAQSWNASTRRGSTSLDPVELSDALRFARSNPLAGLFTNFMNTGKNIVSLASRAADEADAGRYRTSARFAGTLVASSVMYAALQQALLRSPEAGDDDDEERSQLSRTAESVLKRAVTNFVGNFPVLGDVVNAAVRPVLGMKRFGDNPALLHETVQRAANGAVQIGSTMVGLSDEALDQDKFNRRLFETATDLMALRGMPGPFFKQGVGEERAKKAKSPFGSLTGGGL